MLPYRARRESSSHSSTAVTLPTLSIARPTSEGCARLGHVKSLDAFGLDVPVRDVQYTGGMGHSIAIVHPEVRLEGHSVNKYCLPHHRVVQRVTLNKTWKQHQPGWTVYVKFFAVLDFGPDFLYTYI